MILNRITKTSFIKIKHHPSLPSLPFYEITFILSPHRISPATFSTDLHPDTYPAEEEIRRRLEGEDETIDVLSPLATEETVTIESFVLPMLYDIEDSEADDQELIRMSAGTMRKKDIHEGKEYEDDGDGTPRMDAIVTVVAGGKKGRRK